MLCHICSSCTPSSSFVVVFLGHLTEQILYSLVSSLSDDDDDDVDHGKLTLLKERIAFQAVVNDSESLLFFLLDSIAARIDIRENFSFPYPLPKSLSIHSRLSLSLSPPFVFILSLSSFSHSFQINTHIHCGRLRTADISMCKILSNNID